MEEIVEIEEFIQKIIIHIKKQKHTIFLEVRFISKNIITFFVSAYERGETVSSIP